MWTTGGCSMCSVGYWVAALAAALTLTLPDFQYKDDATLLGVIVAAMVTGAVLGKAAEPGSGSPLITSTTSLLLGLTLHAKSGSIEILSLAGFVSGMGIGLALAAMPTVVQQVLAMDKHGRLRDLSARFEEMVLAHFQDVVAQGEDEEQDDELLESLPVGYVPSLRRRQRRHDSTPAKPQNGSPNLVPVDRATDAANLNQQALLVGIIGMGCIGQEHLRNLLLLQKVKRNVKVVAMVDPCAESMQASLEILGKKGGSVNQYETYQQMYTEEPRLDIVIIATPNHTHYDVLRDTLLDTKAAILVEKPLCTQLDQCLEIEAMAQRENRLIWVGMEYRYIPSVTRLIQEAESGRIGELKMLSIKEHRFPFLTKVGRWNRWNQYSGGTLVEKCCHFFDLMRLMLKADPVRVMASGGQDVCYKRCEPASDILDNAYVIVDFNNGSRAMLDLCMFAEASYNQEEISIVGTKGKAEAFGLSHGIRVDDKSRVNFRVGLRPAEEKWDPETNKDPPALCGVLPEVKQEHVGVHDVRVLEAGAHEGATFYELQHFIDAVNRKDVEPEVTLSDGTWAVSMGIAAQESIARGGIPVPVRC